VLTCSSLIWTGFQQQYGAISHCSALRGPEKKNKDEWKFENVHTSTAVLVLLARISVFKVVHGTRIESEKMDVDEEKFLREVLNEMKVMKFVPVQGRYQLGALEHMACS